MIEMYPPKRPGVHYPESDGKPMADNTVQFRWIVTLKESLEVLFADDPSVFVAGNILWYPVEGDPKTRQGPDVLVAFGRPKGERGSYQQWEEGGVAPQVIFEVLSPGNRPGEMDRKFAFYQRHSVEEYYVYTPWTGHLDGWRRVGGRLESVPTMAGYVSPRLGVRFEPQPDAQEILVFHPDGRPFLTYLQTERERRAERERAEEEKRRADGEKQRAEEEKRRADGEKQRADDAEARARRLVERLRELGVDDAGG